MMSTIVPGRQVREFRIGMTLEAAKAKIGFSSATSISLPPRELAPHSEIYQTADRQCLVYGDTRVGLITLIAVVGDSRDSTSSGIHLGMRLGEAVQLDSSLYRDEESGLFTSRNDPGVYFELEDSEPYILGDLSDLIIERIEVTNRYLLDEISIAGSDQSILDAIRQKYIVSC